MGIATSETLSQQFAFLAELDALKSVIRQSPLINRTRKENSAEHSWHVAMFALVLSPHVVDLDVMHVVKLLLLHDIVEIDAGDAPIHAAGPSGLAEAEASAAERIFGLLPSQQGHELLALWQEFEAAETREARFAKALDRLQPLLANTLTAGGTWTKNAVTEAQVIERYGPTIARGSPLLWQEARKLVQAFFNGNDHRLEANPWSRAKPLHAP